MNEPTKEYGYITCLNGQEAGRVFGEKLATDEFWNHHRAVWETVALWGNEWCDSNCYRRRINPGPGCEIVPLDGRIYGDETMSKIYRPTSSCENGGGE